MFNKGTIQEALKVDVAVSNQMANAIDLWSMIYENKAPWLNNNVKSLNLGAAISSEVARMVTLELQSEITKNDYLNKQYQRVLKDLRSLFEMDVNGVYAAVAKDGIYYRFPKEMNEMGLDKRGFYFNSGVMLHNLQEQRQDNIVENLVHYVKTNNDFYGDQDVLNVVLGDKLKLMSYKNNCISTFFEADDLDFLSDYFGENLPKDTFYIYQGATIIHYAGDKPWQDNYSPLYLKELWFRYYNQAKDI